MALNIEEKGLTISKPTSHCKKGKKMKYFLSPSLPFGVRHDNSLVVREVSPGRVIVVLFREKYAVPRRIRPGILNLTIRRGQGNFSIAFIFVSFEEKGYYRVVLVGQLSFDCRSYYGRSRRMQGNSGWAFSSRDWDFSINLPLSLGFCPNLPPFVTPIFIPQNLEMMPFV